MASLHIADELAVSIYEKVKATILNSVYPVGSVYMSFTSTNPSKLFGGTWKSIEGQFLIGVGKHTDDNNETWEFGLRQAYGEFNHVLTVAQIPSHRHNMSPPDPGSGGGAAWEATGRWINSTTAGLNSYTDYTGGGQGHNNMPPYLAVYMWERTA